MNQTDNEINFVRNYSKQEADFKTLLLRKEY